MVAEKFTGDVSLIRLRSGEYEVKIYPSNGSPINNGKPVKEIPEFLEKLVSKLKEVNAQLCFAKFMDGNLKQSSYWA